MAWFLSSETIDPRSLMRLEVRGNVSSKLVGCLIESNLIHHINMLDIGVCIIFMEVFFFYYLSSVKFFCQFTFKSDQHSLRRGKHDARHGTEGPFEEEGKNDVEDIAIYKNTTEQKKEVLVFKKNHLLLTEKDYQKSHSLVTSEGKVGTSEGPKERRS